MTILGIETSCDETALALIDADTKHAQMHADNLREPASVSAKIRVLADKTLSQAALHQRYGGVFPNIAKRAHADNLVPLLKTVLNEASRVDSRFKIKDLGKRIESDLLKSFNLQLKSVLEREPELLKQFLEFISTREKPRIDAIAVTEGPGLEPCLWTGINFAKALSLAWDIPVVPVNHMEGHIFSALLCRKNMTTFDYSLLTVNFPAIALLISGGHTELVLVKDWFDYEIIGETRDDAVGEAFDKVARLLGLPYPGGPEISRLSEQARKAEQGPTFFPTLRSGLVLPRPMLHSDDFDFSFSGLKTAVLYLLKRIGTPDEKTKATIAREFEDAVTEVLITKTRKAIERYGAKTLLIGGGVIANIHIRRAFEDLANTYGRRYLLNEEFLHIPELNLTTDNALMIAVAGFLRLSLKNGSTKPKKGEIAAKGNLRLDEK